MSEKTRFELIKDFFRKVKVRLFSKDALIFLFFLVLSAGFWFVHSLDRQRETTLNIPLDYKGIPEEVEVENKLPKEISIKVRDQGLTLLRYNKSYINPIAIDLNQVYFAKGKIVITPDQLKNRISRYVLPTTAVLGLKPDSIVIQYHKLAAATLPIHFAADITLASQHILSDSTRIEPSTVKVFGPKNIVDTMRSIYTERIQLKDISDTIITKVKLRKPDKGIKYSFGDVKVTVFVEMFTEKKIQIPITVINAPDNINVRIFPPTVEAIYNVGLSIFNKINDNDIKVVFDYNEAKKINKRRYTLQVVNNSHYITDLRLSPEQVEFLFEEK